MLKNIGVDIINNKRIEKLINIYGERFIKKIYTPIEIKYCNSKKNIFENYASHFAAKEAVMKLLSIGASYLKGHSYGISFKDIEVRHSKNGQPLIKLYNKAEELRKEKDIKNIFISLSHEKDYSIALVVGE